MKPIIFGGLDGILTSFAIVAGSAGGGLSPQVVLVLGFSNIFADALRYVSSRSVVKIRYVPSIYLLLETTLFGQFTHGFSFWCIQ